MLEFIQGYKLHFLLNFSYRSITVWTVATNYSRPYTKWKMFCSIVLIPVVVSFYKLLQQLNYQFTDNPKLAVCADSGGSVFELSFKRTLGMRGCDSKCLFSGSRGEVVSVEPLLLHHLNSHPLHGAVLIAMATLSKVLS